MKRPSFLSAILRRREVVFPRLADLIQFYDGPLDQLSDHVRQKAEKAARKLMRKVA